MRNTLLIAVLISFVVVSCKPDPVLTQSLKFEFEGDPLRGEIEIAGHHFVIDDSLELSIVKSRLDAYGIAYEIVPADSEYQYELKLPETADLDAIKRLLTTKGEFGFWEMYQVEELLGVFPMDSLIMYSNYLPNRSEIIVSIKDTATVSAILHRKVEQKNLPNNLKLMWALKPHYNNSTSISLYFLRGSGMNSGAAMDGHYIVDAEARLSKWAPVWEVGMRMDKAGALNWSQLTERNIGRCLAIVIDDQVYSAPMVNAKIEGGRSSITGNFTQDEAKEMAAVLQSSPMPSKIKFLDKKKSSTEK